MFALLDKDSKSAPLNMLKNLKEPHLKKLRKNVSSNRVYYQRQLMKMNQIEIMEWKSTINTIK